MSRYLTMQNTRDRKHPRQKYGEVLYDQPHPHSPAALSLLVVSFWEKDNTRFRKHRWQMFRTQFLTRVLQEQGDLVCHWCGKPHLIMEGSPFKTVHNLATVDHVLQCSKGGGLYDEENVVVSCSKCNTKRH